MFEFESRQIESASGKQRVELMLSGDLVVETVSRLKELLLDLLSDKQHLVIDMERVLNIDFSVMQLLCSTCRYCQQHDKIFELKNQCTEIFIDKAQVLGFFHEKGCVEVKDPEMCLWIAKNLS